MEREVNELDVGHLFVATLQLRTPLYVLRMHGQHCPPGQRPRKPARPWQGIWVRCLPGQTKLYGTMASEIGYVPADGGALLKMLVLAREIAESKAPAKMRRLRLNALMKVLPWPDLIYRLGGDGYIVDYLMEI
ncbi:hypothetical protein D9M72_589160 [compost metagenome]